MGYWPVLLTCVQAQGAAWWRYPLHTHRWSAKSRNFLTNFLKRMCFLTNKCTNLPWVWKILWLQKQSDLTREGRGVWQCPQGGVLFFQAPNWQVSILPVWQIQIQLQNNQRCSQLAGGHKNKKTIKEVTQKTINKAIHNSKEVTNQNNRQRRSHNKTSNKGSVLFLRRTSGGCATILSPSLALN